MSKNVLTSHFINHISQTIRLHIKIRRINLCRSPKHHLSVFTCTGNNRFHLMWCKVLCFINYAECSVRLRPLIKARASISSLPVFCSSSIKRRSGLFCPSCDFITFRLSKSGCIYGATFCFSSPGKYPRSLFERETIGLARSIDCMFCFVSRQKQVPVKFYLYPPYLSDLPV